MSNFGAILAVSLITFVVLLAIVLVVRRFVLRKNTVETVPLGKAATEPAKPSNPDVTAIDPKEAGDQRRLGRLPAIDERSRQPQFAMKLEPSKRKSRNWLSPKWREWPAVLDQGDTSQCVAYSATKFLLTHPIVNRPSVSCEDLYNRAQKLDEWSGEDYDGTSVNAGMKALRDLGFISGWTWAFDVETVVRHLLEVGPVCLGTDWTNDMFNPDTKGYIHPTGHLSGGHAYLAVGVNRSRKNPDGSLGAIRILNSWGPNWGDNGRAWLSFKDLEILLRGMSGWPGEAAAPTEVKLLR